MDKKNNHQQEQPGFADLHSNESAVGRLIFRQLEIMRQQIEILKRNNTGDPFNCHHSIEKETSALLNDYSTLSLSIPVSTSDRNLESKHNEASKTDGLESDTILQPLSGQQNGFVTEKKDYHRIPFTEAQREVWLASMLSDFASCAFNESTVIHLKGPFKAESMQAALHGLVERYEALRTTFDATGDFQQISASAAFDYLYLDYSNWADKKRDKAVSTILEEEAQKAFNLEHGPLLRTKIIKINYEYHLLVITAHHIVCDGWSFDIMVRDLSRAYNIMCEGLSDNRPIPTMQMSDYALWHENNKDSIEFLAAEAYWLKQFTDTVPELELPSDRQRPPIKSYRGARETKILEGSLYAKIKEIGAKQRVTLFGTFLSAYVVLLHRLTGQKDIVIGIPAAGQSLVGSHDLVGHCTNLLPLRVRINGTKTFNDLLGIVKNIVLDAHENQAVTFGHLIKKLKIKRDPSRTPLVSVLFNIDPAIHGMKFKDLDMEYIANPRCAFQFDMGFNLVAYDNKLICESDYSTDLFDAESINRWLENYQTLIKGIVADPDQQIGLLPILPESERKQLIAWNETHMEYPSDKCLHQLFELQVERTPDLMALVGESENLTYRELNNKANLIAQRIISMGVGPDIIVGVFLERSTEMIAAILGILKAGGAYLPLDPEYPKDRLAFMLLDSQTQVLVTQSKLKLQLPNKCPEILCLDTDMNVSVTVATENPQLKVQPNHLAYLLYTSGSTGVPKGVAIEHHSPVALICWAHEVFSEKEMGGVLFSTSICFDLSVFEIFSPLTMGGKVILADNLLELPSLTAASKVTLINTVPSAIAELLRIEGIPSSVCTVNLAGELLKSSLVNKIYDVKTIERVYDLYGPSEDTTYSTWVLRKSDGPQTIGRPISNTQAYIIDPQKQLVPIGVNGELYLGGDGLARGYLHRPDLTAEKFITNPFKDSYSQRLYATGDLSRYLPDGNLVFMGRIDHQVKIRGFRIELGEIEAVLSDYPSVKNQVVVANELKPGDYRIIAYIVTKNKDISLADLRAHLAKKLPNYMIPSNFIELDTLPLTPNGKVDRKALPAPDNLRPELIATYVKPRTETEYSIASIWKEVLNVERIGIHDNFFELGGHSLLATRVLSRLNQSFQANLKLHIMFDTHTIAELAVVIENFLMEEIDTLTEEDAERLLSKEEKEDA